MKEVVIVSAVRTPIGSFMGNLSSIPATKLGATAIKAALEKINLNPAKVDEVLMGSVLQASLGQAPARQAALFAGIPNSVPCTTVNKVCASGMKAIMQGAQAIKCGDAEIVIAGGMENMSLIPHYLYARTGTKFGPASLIDGMQKDGLVDAYDQNAMGVCADACAREYKFSREDQDALGLRSQQLAEAAIKAGKFKDQIVPVPIPQRKGDPISFDTDECPQETSLEALSKMRPAFKKDGSVTAGNSSGINDGAAAALVVNVIRCFAASDSSLVMIFRATRFLRMEACVFFAAVNAASFIS